MLKIKLQPTGKRHQKYYRIVVAEDKSKLSGTVVASIGTYNPADPKNQIEINKTDYQLWLGKGAQPTDTVRKLFEKIS